MDDETRKAVAEGMQEIKNLIGPKRLFAMVVVERPFSREDQGEPEVSHFADVPLNMPPEKARQFLVHLFEYAAARLRKPPPAGQERKVEERPLG